jgi:hypothetical protein
VQRDIHPFADQEKTTIMSRFRVLLQSSVLAVLTSAGCLLTAAPASAQYLGNNFHGDFGVNSGSQAGPGVYFALPFAQWNVDQIKNADGNEVLPETFQGFDVRAILPTVIAVTPKKVAGAYYGLMVAVPFSTTRPERAIADEIPSDWDLNDLYVVPLYLGWHKPRADFIAGYGFYAPTGRYEAGGQDNVGLGMWGHEFQGGATVYLDAAKTVSAATTAYLELHSNKRDQDLKVGTLLTLEGGLAYNVPKIAGAFGIGYYMQQKLTDDSGSDLPLSALQALNLYGKNRLFGIGPDVSMAVFKHGGTIGLVNVRYLWESAGSSSFQGSTVLVGVTIARPKTN